MSQQDTRAGASASTQAMIIDAVRSFVEAEVIPVASALERSDTYPHELIGRMRTMGLFGTTIDEAYGGLGLDVATYASLIEEIARGWMSLSGVLNTHLLVAYLIGRSGTPEQRERYLPRMATGEWRAAIAITEAHAGSDVQAIRTTARRDGDGYVVSGAKQFITNAREASVIATVVKTDRDVRPPYRGMSIMLIEKDHAGLSVGPPIGKLGYRSVETCEVVFDEVRVPTDRLLGGAPGEGFAQVMSALELGRINVAARGVGLARAAFEAAIAYAQKREAFGRPIADHQSIQIKLADMATRIEAARHLVRAAALRKDRGERADLEAGMAKLFATETAAECALESMRIHGGIGYTDALPVERYYRDAPLLLIGEGTNEVQRLLIARQLLARHTPAGLRSPR